MAEIKNKRWRVMADAKLQGSLCIRIAIYWLVCQLVVVGTIFGFSTLEGASGGTGSVTRFFTPALLISLCVLPIVLLDMLVFSNRFAGPMVQFRRAFKNYVNHGKSDQLRFRGGDYYLDICNHFNKMQTQQQLKAVGEETPADRQALISTELNTPNNQQTYV